MLHLYFQKHISDLLEVIEYITKKPCISAQTSTKLADKIISS